MPLVCKTFVRDVVLDINKDHGYVYVYFGALKDDEEDEMIACFPYDEFLDYLLNSWKKEDYLVQPLGGDYGNKKKN